MSSNSVEVLACKLNELAVGSMKELELNGRMILLSRSSDGVFATSHLCTHYGAPLIKGVINGNRVMCPWHGACFNLKQGDLEDSPGIDHLEHFDVKIKGDEIFVSVPLTSSSGKRRPDFACKKAISSKTVVVVGGGAAGYTAVETLRKEGFDGRVVLISSEEFLPYDRPKLSKNLSLSGEAIALRDRQFYDEIGVELVLGTSVEELDAATKLIKLSSGKTISYDDVIVCSGSRPFVIPIPGSNLEGVLTLRGPKEANHIDQLSLPDSKVIIIGTGFIGLELATYLKNVKKVKDVICVSQDKFPLARVFGDRIGAYLKGVYESNGVKLMLNTHLEEIIGKDGKVQSLKIKEQVEPLPCDFVVMGAGVRLNTGFLKNVELHERDKSVIVDEFMRSASGVFCAGDIARFPYQLSTSGVEFTRIEHWSVAQNQGRIAAQNLLGKRIPYSQTPFFWTVQFPGNLRYVGHAFNFDDVVVDGNPEKDGKFVAYFILKDEIKAVATLGRDPVAAAASELFRMKKMPGAAEVRSSNLDLVGMLSAMQK